MKAVRVFLPVLAALLPAVNGELHVTLAPAYIRVFITDSPHLTAV